MLSCLQKECPPPEVTNLRSGRVSKLTERFSLYRANSASAKQAVPREDQCDSMSACEEDLSDVVAALCVLGQPLSSQTAVGGE